ncbi:hypothetical protein SRABI106_04727 [Rahnella aquatilis]|nr:hypothetical protein SRABI106_04727 [Rahnella aquatilis]
MHRTGEHHADQDPDRARQETHLRSQYRADQRTRACDGGKVVAEQNPFIGRHIIQPVVTTLGRCHAFVIKFEDFFGDKQAVETVGNAVTGNGSDHQPQGVNMFAPAQGQHSKGKSPD